jgi:uncharacterized protein YjbJ (UPF0337 family)
MTLEAETSDGLAVQRTLPDDARRIAASGKPSPWARLVAIRNCLCCNLAAGMRRSPAPETIRMERSSRRTVSLAFPQSEEKIVDKEHVKGAADKAKGAIKDALGKMTGDKKMQVEGKVDKTKGAAHEAVGDVKDAARQADKR